MIACSSLNNTHSYLKPTSYTKQQFTTNNNDISLGVNINRQLGAKVGGV